MGLKKKYIYIYDISSLRVNDLTLILLTWRKWWAPNNASKQQMGFNSAFKGLTHTIYKTLVYADTQWHLSTLPVNPIHTALQCITYKVPASRQLSQYSDYTAGLITWQLGLTSGKSRDFIFVALCLAVSSPWLPRSWCPGTKWREHATDHSSTSGARLWNTGAIAPQISEGSQ